MIINYCSILISKGVYKDQIETFDVGEIEKLELRVNPPAPKPYISTTPEPKFTLKENIMYGGCLLICVLILMNNPDLLDWLSGSEEEQEGDDF
jgi:hypothetical protein